VRLALSEISTVGAPFAEDVRAYAAAGFEAIGLWEFKLPDDDGANRALLREHGLAVANCIPALPSVLQLRIPGMEGPADPEERIESICASVRRLAAYEPESVLCLTGPAGDLDPGEARRIVVAGLRRIAAAARESGVRLGLEPIQPAQHETASFVHTVADATALLAEAGLDDVGIMVDTYNLWDDAGAVEWLAANGGRVTGVHVADRPARDRDDRVLPGEAGARTRELLDAARAGGWDGSVDVEIFSEPERFWGLPVDEAASRAHAAATALLV
jgi:sugar phosphate isomerase/epimerase